MSERVKSDLALRKAHHALLESGYTCQLAAPGPAEALQTFRLEWWTGRKGVVLLQIWAEDGVTTFVNWGHGESWDDFLNAL